MARQPVRTWLLVAGAASLVAVGCSPFDPNLGAAPFRCGTSQPLCPAGYSCDGEPGTGVCLRLDDPDRPDAAPPLLDAPPFACDDDSFIEPNDTLENAFPTPVMDDMPMVSYASLAICPDTDIDFFRVNINVPATGLRAEITHEANQGLLALELLNMNGDVIRQGTPVTTGSMNLLRAEVPNTNVGVHFVKVEASASGIRNNYSLRIETF